MGEVKGGNCGTVHGGLRKSKKAEFREGRREGKGGDCSHEIKRRLLLERSNLDIHQQMMS